MGVLLCSREASLWEVQPDIQPTSPRATVEVSLLGSLQGEIGVPTPWGQGFCTWFFASHRK